jgi:uncharacterized membrane protein YfcA
VHVVPVHVVTIGDSLFLVVAGFVAGAINAVAGGGSLVTFPALLAVGFPPLVANVTNTVGVLPGYLGSTIAYRDVLATQRSRATALAITGLAGAAVGCVVLLVTPAGVFESLVPFLVLGACVLLAVQPRVAAALRRRDPHGTGRRPVVLHLGVFLSAVYGAYFGAALGVLLLGVLGMLLRDSLQRLNALKGALSLVINVLAAVAFALFGPVAWVGAALLAGSSLAGGHLGASLARRLSDRLLRGTVLVVGIGAAIALLL